MDIKIVDVPVDQIQDWKTFHEVFKNTFGFPDFYGCNMDAWNDCMGDIDLDSGMTGFTVEKDGLVVMKIDNAPDFKKRCPEQYEALIEGCAFVNKRRIETGHLPILALMLIGFR